MLKFVLRQLPGSRPGQVVAVVMFLQCPLRVLRLPRAAHGTLEEGEGVIIGHVRDLTHREYDAVVRSDDE